MGKLEDSFVLRYTSGCWEK